MHFFTYYSILDRWWMPSEYVKIGGLPRRLVLLSDSKVAATTQADTTASEPVHKLMPELIDTPGSDVEKFCA
jgi:hypothetical protein